MSVFYTRGQQTALHTLGLHKTAGSRIRSAIKLIWDPTRNKFYIGTKRHAIGEISVVPELMTGHPKINKAWIAPEFRGMGLGKKMYGEVMRRMPERRLLSDVNVSEDAKRVWDSLRKRKSYEILDAPPRSEIPRGSVWGAGSPHMGQIKSPKAQKGTPKELLQD